MLQHFFGDRLRRFGRALVLSLERGDGEREQLQHERRSKESDILLGYDIGAGANCWTLLGRCRLSDGENNP